MPSSEHGIYGTGGLGCLLIPLFPVALLVVTLVGSCDELRASTPSTPSTSTSGHLDDGTYSFNFEAESPWFYQGRGPGAPSRPGSITYDGVVVKGDSVTTRAHLTNTGQTAWEVDCAEMTARDGGHLNVGPNLADDGSSTSTPPEQVKPSAYSCLADGSAEPTQVLPGHRVDLSATYENSGYLTHPLQIVWTLCQPGAARTGGCWERSLRVRGIEEHRR